MRGAPHSGLAAAIFMIKARISGIVSGQPRRFLLEIQVQKSRKPLRCQDTTVSGWTMIKARRQSFHVRERHSQNHRSAFLQSRSWAAPLEHGELLAEGQVLQ